jgi:hypothetical protein
MRGVSLRYRDGRTLVVRCHQGCAGRLPQTVRYRLEGWMYPTVRTTVMSGATMRHHKGCAGRTLPLTSGISMRQNVRSRLEE